MPVLGIAGALAGVAVMLAVMSGNGKNDRPVPRRTNKPVGPTVAPPPIATAAGRVLAKIKAMRTPDLAKYAEMRDMLERFPQHFDNSPEAAEAKAFLAEIDAARGTLATDALAAARAAAATYASEGRFDEAESSIVLVEDTYGEDPWYDSKGEAALAEARAEIEKLRGEWKIKNAAATLEKARSEFEAGRLDEASGLIADRTQWADDARAKADTLAEEIERKLAALTAAKNRAAALEGILAEFDRLMIAREYAGAKKHAETQAETAKEIREILGAAARVAGARGEWLSAAVRGAKDLAGDELRLGLTTGSMAATIKSASEAGLSVAKTFTINGRTTETQSTVSWSELASSQKDEFARLGGFRVDETDASIVAAYGALSDGDVEAAREYVEAASDHPLAERLARVVKQRRTHVAYEAAMERARTSAADKKWKDVVTACKVALTHKPGDKEATELLATVPEQSLPSFGKNLVVNGGAEKYPFKDNGWTALRGNWVQKAPDVLHLGPKDGQSIFSPWTSSSAELYQDVPLRAYSDGIKSGTQLFKFTGHIAGFHELRSLVLEWRDQKGNILDKFKHEGSQRDWTVVEQTLRPPVGSTTARVRLYSRKKKGSHNNGYFDDIRLVPLKPGDQ
jgi:hypothetical protein